ncbi:MAG: hypothetical protein ABL996_25565 [Micropepsaceae bacterium]
MSDGPFIPVDLRADAPLPLPLKAAICGFLIAASWMAVFFVLSFIF